MEVNLKDLMDKSEITTDDLDYIVERLMSDGLIAYELTVAFIEAYKRARTILDEKDGKKPYYTSSATVAGHISDWCNSYSNYIEDNDDFP